MCLKGRCGLAGESVEGEKQRACPCISQSIICFGVSFFASSAWELCRKVSGRHKIGDSTEEMGVLVVWIIIGEAPTDPSQIGKQNPEQERMKNIFSGQRCSSGFLPVSSMLMCWCVFCFMAVCWWSLFFIQATTVKLRLLALFVTLVQFEWLIERFIRVCYWLVSLCANNPDVRPIPRGLDGSTWRLIGFHCG